MPVWDDTEKNSIKCWIRFLTWSLPHCASWLRSLGHVYSWGFESISGPQCWCFQIYERKHTYT